MVFCSNSEKLTLTAPARSNVDERAAIERISELENRVRLLTEERNNQAATIVNYEAFLKRIPRELPGGLDPDSMTPNSWLDWALKELGYSKIQG